MSHFLLVVYDISNDKRRTKLHRRLLDFGTPVQFSVFECCLDEQSVIRLRTAIKKITRPTLDHVRIYHLCAGCRKRTEVFGRVEITTIPEVIIV